MINQRNKHFVINDLYVGKPFLYHTDGLLRVRISSKHRCRRVGRPFVRWGLLVDFDIKKEQYNIGWCGMSTSNIPTYVRYNLDELLNKEQLYYGYGEGQSVMRVTDGKTFTISKISTKPNDFYVQTVECGNKAKYSYGLFIPHPTETFVVNPFVYQKIFSDNLFNIS